MDIVWGRVCRDGINTVNKLVSIWSERGAEEEQEEEEAAAAREKEIKFILMS